MTKPTFFLLALPILVAAVTPGFAQMAPADVIVLKYAHDYPASSIRQTVGQKFATLAAEKTGGRVKVEIYPAGQLYAGKDVVSAVAMGTIQLAMPPIGTLEPYNKEFAALRLPLLLNSIDALRRLEDSELAASVAKKLELKGIKALIWVSQGSIQMVTNNKKPLRTVEDFKGLKIRVANSAVYDATFKALGASPTTISAAEAYMAHQQGTVDADHTTPSSASGDKLYTVQKYATLVPITLPTSIFVANLAFWNGLPADIRQTMEKDVLPETLRFAREELDRFENASMENLKKEGMEIIAMSPEEIVRLRKALQPVYDRFGPEVGKDLIAKLQAFNQ